MKYANIVKFNKMLIVVLQKTFTNLFKYVFYIQTNVYNANICDIR